MITNLLLPQPSVQDLANLQNLLDKTQAEMAELFDLSDGSRWREYISGKRKMDAHRYSLTLLQLGLHTNCKAVQRPNTGAPK